MASCCSVLFTCTAHVHVIQYVHVLWDIFIYLYSCSFFNKALNGVSLDTWVNVVTGSLSAINRYILHVTRIHVYTALVQPSLTNCHGWTVCIHCTIHVPNTMYMYCTTVHRHQLWIVRGSETHAME